MSPKPYTVQVEVEFEPKTVWVRVDADSEDDAQDKALRIDLRAEITDVPDIREKEVTEVFEELR